MTDTGRTIWLAIQYDKYDGGRGWVAVTATAERGRDLCEQHYAEDDDVVEPLGEWELSAHSVLSMSPRWTADVPDSSSWYDVIELNVIE